MDGLRISVSDSESLLEGYLRDDYDYDGYENEHTWDDYEIDCIFNRQKKDCENIHKGIVYTIERER